MNNNKTEKYSEKINAGNINSNNFQKHNSKKIDVQSNNLITGKPKLEQTQNKVKGFEKIQTNSKEPISQVNISVSQSNPKIDLKKNRKKYFASSKFKKNKSQPEIIKNGIKPEPDKKFLQPAVEKIVSQPKPKQNAPQGAFKKQKAIIPKIISQIIANQKIENVKNEKQNYAKEKTASNQIQNTKIQNTKIQNAIILNKKISIQSIGNEKLASEKISNQSNANQSNLNKKIVNENISNVKIANEKTAKQKIAGTENEHKNIEVSGDLAGNHYVKLLNVVSPKLSIKKTNEKFPLMLAFIGDAVHTLFVRSFFMASSAGTPETQHNLSSNYCRAKSQSEALDYLHESLSEQEQDLAKRTRNAKNHSSSKNTSPEDYKKATAFEAIVGYLYLSNQIKRLQKLLLKFMEKK